MKILKLTLICELCMYMFSAKWESVQFRNCTCAIWEFLLCPPIPELYQTILELRKGYFIDFCYNQALRKVGMGWTKWELGEHAWESHFNFDRLQRGVLSFSNSNITRWQPLQTHYILFALFACSAIQGLSCMWLFERERERENILIYWVGFIRVSLNMYQMHQFWEREREKEMGS